MENASLNSPLIPKSTTSPHSSEKTPFSPPLSPRRRSSSSSTNTSDSDTPNNVNDQASGSKTVVVNRRIPCGYLPHEIFQAHNTLIKNSRTTGSPRSSSDDLEFSEQEKKIFRNLISSAFYVSAIRRYYLHTKKPLPTSRWRHPFGQFGLTEQQLKDLSQVILWNVERVDADYPRTPLSTLVALEGINTTSGVPTVDSAFRGLLTQNVYSKLTKLGVACVACFLSFVTWLAYVVYPKRTIPSPSPR